MLVGNDNKFNFNRVYYNMGFKPYVNWQGESLILIEIIITWGFNPTLVGIVNINFKSVLL